MSSCSQHEHDNALHGVHGHHDIKARLAEAEILCMQTCCGRLPDTFA